MARIAEAIIKAAPPKVIRGFDWPHIPDSTRDTCQLLNPRGVWTGIPARLFDY